MKNELVIPSVKRKKAKEVNLTEARNEPSSDQAFIERMNKCAEIAGSVNALAREAGLSQSGIRRYFEGGEPTRPVISAIASAAGVSFLWLATGEGPMRPGEARTSQEKDGQEGSGEPTGAASFDRKLMEDCIAGVDTYLDRNDFYLPSEKKARLIMLLYDHFAKTKTKTNKHTIAEYVALCA